VLERYQYDAYGKPYFCEPNFVLLTNQESGYDNAILFCGYRFDPETGKYHARHRDLDDYTGRWFTHDPVGYIDGLNLYEYVRSKPVNNYDPLGLLIMPWVYDIKVVQLRLLRTILTQALLSEDNNHKDRLYYRSSNIGPLTQRLIDVVNKINIEHSTISLYLKRNTAQYIPLTNTMQLDSNNFIPDDIVHETVHALDDMKDWYIKPSGTDEISSEALAHGTEYLLRYARESHFQNCENAKNCQKASKMWMEAWKDMNWILKSEYVWISGDSVRLMQPSDLEDVEAKLGLKFKCTELKPLYEQHLKKRELCCTLTCHFDLHGDFSLPPVFMGED